MDGWIGEWMDGWMDGWTDGYKYRNVSVDMVTFRQYGNLL